MGKDVEYFAGFYGPRFSREKVTVDEYKVDQDMYQILKVMFINDGRPKGCKSYRSILTIILAMELVLYMMELILNRSTIICKTMIYGFHISLRKYRLVNVIVF